MTEERKVRVLISKLGLDGHDVGAKMVARALRQAGMEVVYLGRFQTPDAVVRAALQEDVDVIGVSVLSGEQLTLVPQLVARVKEAGPDLAHVRVIVGGIFPKEDIPALKAAGVNAVFMGTLFEPAIEYIRENARSQEG